jgi:hypothetical protein
MAEPGTDFSSAAAEITSRPIDPIIEALISTLTRKTRLSADLVESIDKASAGRRAENIERSDDAQLKPTYFRRPVLPNSAGACSDRHWAQ